MLSKAEEYQELIQQATQTITLFHNINNQGKKYTITWQRDIKLSLLHPLKSSQQNENVTPIKNQITHQILKYHSDYQKRWPLSCIGLAFSEHHQNNQKFYVYGTGILIHNNIVFTSAQNVYCRRLHTQYRNIRFITGVHNNKCSGIYDVKRVHYPKEYIMQQKYENYNFAVLQLYDDLRHTCGYVGWKTADKTVEAIEYIYVNDDKQISFQLQQIKNMEKSEQNLYSYSGSGILIKKEEDMYFLVGLHNRSQGNGYNMLLNQQIRNKINQWTQSTTINLCYTNISAQGCKYLSQINQIHHFNAIHLYQNNINSQGCKYLSQGDWIYLTKIYLGNNNIGAQGCKYLKQAKFTHLTQIYLGNNNIRAQGCKYLSQADWRHLKTINLNYNKIGAQGCKYLSQANWRYLTTIDLWKNNISEQGCKYLSQANWTDLATINLDNNQYQYQTIIIFVHKDVSIQLMRIGHIQRQSSQLIITFVHKDADICDNQSGYT